MRLPDFDRTQMPEERRLDVRGPTNVFSGMIPTGLEELLAENPQGHVQHSAWNFCGYIKFIGDGFMEEVWCFKSPVAWFAAHTIKALVAEVNNEFGWD